MNQLQLTGLSSQEVEELRAVHGKNTVLKERQWAPILAFLEEFKSPLLILLIGASTISFFMPGQRISASLILLMVIMSAVLDFVHTRRSEKVAAALTARVASVVKVLRDGKRSEISIQELVPGDIVFLESGNVIPADGRLLEADDLFVNQSALTGESFPVEKHPVDTFDVNAHTPLQIDDIHALFMGTSVVTGFGTMVIDQIGGATRFGHIAASLQKTRSETGFDKGLRTFSLFVMKLAVVMMISVFVVNVLLGRGMFDAFLFSVAIAVGLTPELLPVIMSVALAHGSMVMSKKDVIVKNLDAIQNFGGMNILCTDKTGTLTEDHITLVKCVDQGGTESATVMRYAYCNSVFHTARKSPLDAAIQEHAAIDTSAFTKVDEIPFDFLRRRDTLVLDEDGVGRVMVTKGAPESILEVCTHAEGHVLSDEGRARIMDTYTALSSDGFRVLAIATRELPHEERIDYQKEEEAGMQFLGFAAFLDPPKQSAATTINELRELDVEIKILTGDSEVLTARICRDLGLPVSGMLTGSEISILSDEELTERLRTVNICARVSPEQKERIVNLLRTQGAVVGYLGDGINDAPVLHAADVGISVNNAVDVAKETADIILLSKSLGALREGIIEGRKTFLNTQKYVKLGFSSNFGNMVSMMGASVFLPFLPMLPTQILLNNFLYDLSQTTLPTDHTDPERTKEPLRWDMHGFSRYIVVFGLASAIFDVLTFVLLYRFLELGESGFQTGWFIESIATQVLIILVIRTKRVPFFTSRPSVFVFASAVLIVALAWAIPYTPIGALLGFVPLALPILGLIAGIVVAYLLVGEVTKYWFYRRYPKVS